MISRCLLDLSKNSPRLQAVKAGGETGQPGIYTDFFSNHISDIQIAQTIQWMINSDLECSFCLTAYADVVFPDNQNKLPERQ